MTHPRTFDGLPIMPPFKPRFLTEAQLLEGINLYHLGRGQSRGPNRNYDGLLYASSWLAKNHPGLSSTAAYKDLSDWHYS